MLFSVLRQSCFKGFNAGALRLDHIALPTGENAVPYLVPQLKLQAGAVLHLLPDTTKDKKGGCIVSSPCPVMSCASPLGFKWLCITMKMQNNQLLTSSPGPWQL